MRLFLLFVFLPLLSSAQTLDLKDPDIVWAIALTQDWNIDLPSLEFEINDGINTLKLLRIPGATGALPGNTLAEFVLDAVKRGDLPVFKDSSCSMRTSLQEAWPRQDSIYPYDPEENGGKMIIIYSAPNPFGDIKGWRLQQTLAFHKKSARYSTQVNAVAPLVIQQNDAGDSIGLRPLFWFKPANKRPNLLSNDIIWAKQTSNKQPGTQVRTPPESTALKLNKEFYNPLTRLADLMMNDPKAEFYDEYNEKPIVLPSRLSLVASSDTLVFDAGTDKERIQVAHIPMNMDNIRELRLLQTWYWDERRHQLSICLDAVAPLQWIFDENGGFRYKKVLFYRRAEGE